MDNSYLELFVLCYIYSIIPVHNNSEYYHEINKEFIINIVLYSYGFIYMNNFILKFIYYKDNIRLNINNTDINNTNIIKISESYYSLLYNSFITLYIYDYLVNKEWFYDIDKITYSYSQTNHVHLMTHQVHIIYVIQVAHYIVELYNILFRRRLKKKDDNQMIIHHIITLSMILLSYQYNYLCLGLYIMFIHHINDIFLHISKLMVYYNYPEYITNISFMIFLYSWFYTRLYLFHEITYYITIYYTLTLSKTIITGCVYILQYLNLYWFLIILKVLKNILLNKKAEDIRE